MKVLHTSDWHLGRTIYGRRCTAEFQQFLDWLVSEITRLEIDCLLIAGDVFDNTTPSNTSQAQYYSFLHRVSQTCCRHVVVIGGNHDSPSLLNAPRRLLQHLHVFVVGSITDDLADEVILLRDHENKPEAIICAVPYLRDRDVRHAESYESIEDKSRKLILGIQEHYRRVVDIALQLRKELSLTIPIIALGHLFTAGGKVAEGDEVRDLYVGTLAHIHSSAFPSAIDYLALGHLHLAQQVNSCENMRYSGAPLQLGFGKKNRRKTMTLIQFEDAPRISEVPVPTFLRFETIQGDHPQVMHEIERFLADKQKILLEIDFNGDDVGLFRQELDEKLKNSSLELVRIINQQVSQHALHRRQQTESLRNLDEQTVFQRCLDAHDVKPAERQELEHCFARTLELLRSETENEEDP